MYHVLIPDNVDNQAIQKLEQHEAFSVNAPGKMAHDALLAAVPDAHAMIIRSGVQINAEVLAAASNLKAIARAGVGVDNVDLAEATRRGVVVMNTPYGNTVSTAEYAFGLMLALARHIPQGHGSLQTGRWDRKLFTGVELRGKTLGIVGLGRVGTEVAKRALAFAMDVIAYDPRHPLGPAQDLPDVTMTTLDDLYAQADFISLHSALTDETRGMVCAECIIRMKPGVRIINTARGALINDADLATAIQRGHVAGAALDVYDPEPPAEGNPLLGLDRVIHTPHLAASTTDAQVQVGLDAADQIIEGLANGTFQNVVNPAVLEAQ